MLQYDFSWKGLKKGMTILYSSKYGASKEYAQILAVLLNAEIYPIDMYKHQAQYDDIVFVSGVYKGKIRKLESLKKSFDRVRTVIAVGMFSEDRHYVRTVRDNNMHYQFERIPFFYVPGALYSSKLTTFDRIAARKLAKRISKKPEDRKHKWERSFASIAGSDVSFVSEQHLGPIVDYLLS